MTVSSSVGTKEKPGIDCWGRYIGPWDVNAKRPGCLRRTSATIATRRLMVPLGWQHVIFSHGNITAQQRVCRFDGLIVLQCSALFLNRARSKRRSLMQRSNILGYTQAFPNQTNRWPLRAPTRKAKNKIRREEHRDMCKETSSCSR